MRIAATNWYQRGKFKNTSKKIFRRLVMDRQAERVSDSQNVIIIILILSLIVSVVLLSGIAEIKSGAFSAIFDRLPEIPGVPVEYSDGIWATLLLLAALIPLASIRTYLSKKIYNLAGTVLVYGPLLKPNSDAAKTNNADVKYWLRSDPQRVVQEITDYFGENAKAEDFVPNKVVSALKDLQSEESPLGFVVCRGLLERKYWINYLRNYYRTPRPREDRGGENASYFVISRMLRNAIKMAMCFDVLNVELRDEAPNGYKWCWDYYSRTDYQQVPMWDEHDLPLRFRSASPHLRWPEYTDLSSDGEIPLIRAFSCLENPMGFKIRVLKIKDVVEYFPKIVTNFFPDCAGDQPADDLRRKARAAKFLSVLANKSVKVIVRHDFKTMLPLTGRDATDKPLLIRLDGKSTLLDDQSPDDLLSADWGIRWDPSRIAWSEFKAASDGELLQALAILTDAVNEVMREKAEKVRLRRGDVMFIDNQRCIASRFEREITKTSSIRSIALLQPGEWWIRRFYGFRVSRNNDFDQIASQKFGDDDPDCLETPPPGEFVSMTSTIKGRVGVPRRHPTPVPARVRGQ